MCLFCDIAQGQIKTQKLYEDLGICVFPDINPKAVTHLLIIPKIHIVDLRDLDSSEKKEAICHLISTIPHIVEKLGVQDFQLICRNGSEAGQEIFHLHFHLLSSLPLRGSA